VLGRLAASESAVKEREAIRAELVKKVAGAGLSSLTR